MSVKCFALRSMNAYSNNLSTPPSWLTIDKYEVERCEEINQLVLFVLCRSAFVLWVSMNIMILVVPRYGAYLMALTGLMMLFSDAVFWNLIPQRPLMIHIEVQCN